MTDRPPLAVIHGALVLTAVLVAQRAAATTWDVGPLQRSVRAADAVLLGTVEGRQHVTQTRGGNLVCLQVTTLRGLRGPTRGARIEVLVSQGGYLSDEQYELGRSYLFVLVERVERAKRGGASLRSFTTYLPIEPQDPVAIQGEPGSCSGAAFLTLLDPLAGSRLITTLRCANESAEVRVTLARDARGRFDIRVDGAPFLFFAPKRVAPRPSRLRCTIDFVDVRATGTWTVAQVPFRFSVRDEAPDAFYGADGKLVANRRRVMRATLEGTAWIERAFTEELVCTEAS